VSIRNFSVIRISGIGKAYRSSAVAGVQGANFAFYIREFEQKVAKITKGDRDSFSPVIR
jgi:hypothetical protein